MRVRACGKGLPNLSVLEDMRWRVFSLVAVTGSRVRGGDACAMGAMHEQRGNTKTGSPGNDLLSQGPAPQVPSALEGLTAWFGMEQGVSPPHKSPEEPVFYM